MYCVVISTGDKIIQIEGPYIRRSQAIAELKKSQALAEKIEWMKDIDITRLVYPLVGPDITEEEGKVGP